MLFADAEEKVNKYKEKLKALGETISDDEDDGEDDDEEGDADEDEDEENGKEDETSEKGEKDVD